MALRQLRNYPALIDRAMPEFVPVALASPTVERKIAARYSGAARSELNQE